jgi:cytoplasmic iron level regulating protein YaaA (DUF328/UPF0246 family)
MAPRTLILIPPSEGKAIGGDGPPYAAGTMRLPELDHQRAAVLKALGPKHDAVVGPTLPAMDRYTGVLYQELNARGLSAGARRRFVRDTLTVSGLWGLVSPTDPIPFYKLKMSGSVKPLGKLSTWWRPAVSDALADRSAGAVVWDLLPQEHSAAVDWSSIKPKLRVTVRFVDRHDKTVSHWNKLLKGSLVAWLAETGVTEPEDVAEFDHPRGYVLDPLGSTVDGTLVQLVLREQA